MRTGIVILAAAGALGTVLAITASPAASAHTPGATTTMFALQDPSDGSSIYAAQCAPCHGSQGEGASAPSLQQSTLSSDERTAVIRDGRLGMPAFGPTLQPAQIQAVSDLTSKFIGIGIFAAQCAPCHGEAGEGGIGPSLVASTLLPSEATAVIAEGRAAMPAFGPTLTEEAIGSVVAFVGALGSDQTAGAALYASQCAPCHGDNREGGVGPSLLSLDLDLAGQTKIITEGRGAMPAFGPTLTGEQMRVLEVFLSSGTDEPDEPDTTGAAETYAAQCAGCHGAQREGGIGPALTDIVATEEETALIVAEGAGAMPGFKDTLTSDELAALVAFLTQGGDPGTTPPLDPAALARAAELYGANCRTCHGAAGEGGAGPSLIDMGLTDDELQTIIAQGAGSMPGFSTSFTEDEITAMARHVAELGGDTTPPTDTSLDAPPGEAIYLGNCAVCHGPFGEGDSGPQLAGNELSVNEIVVGVWSGHSEDMPAFHESLTPDEILAVSNYAAGLPPLASSELGEEGSQDGLEARTIISLIVAGAVAVGLGVIAFGGRPRARNKTESG